MGNNAKGPFGQGLSPDDLARLDSWLSEIVAAVHGPGRGDLTGDIRFKSNDSLAVHCHTGFWHDFVSREGGVGALSFLAYAHGGAEAGLRIARQWLGTSA
jgi:hypothetical protein